MSLEIHQFLDNCGGNNFTENAPRPPVGPGEENELRSTGGQSNKSSGSQKSQASNKSAGSGTGGATPRRLQKTSKLPPTTSSVGVAGGPAIQVTSSDSSKGKSGPNAAEEEHDAPLGFEPEGSVDERAGFTESGSPACARWSESLEKLLEDADGVSLFKSYLTQENSDNLFDFYFAWKGLQNLDAESQTSDISNLVRAMYKAFCKGEKKLPFLTADAKDKINKQISSKTDLKNTFNSLKDQVLDILNRVFYVPFFKSSAYLHYIDNLEGSPKESSTHSSGCASAQPVTMILPTVHEDSELDLRHTVAAEAGELDPVQQLSLTVKNMKITERLRLESKIKPEEQAGYYLQKLTSSAVEGGSSSSLPPHPYHTSTVSYLPISAIDSERQSLSSEALTDDTHSVTDSSVDGFPLFTNKKSVQRHYRKIKNSAQRNPESHSSNHHHLLPQKNHRLVKVPNLAEVKPAEFAKVLSEKLQRVLDEQIRREMVRSKLNAMSEDEGTTDDSRSVLSGNTAGASTTNTALNQLLVAMQAGDHDAEAQDILDMHCKRIWERSGHHTPSKSPSRSKSPEMFPTAPLFNPQSKRTHSVPRPMPPSASSSSGRPPFSMPYGTKPPVAALTSSTVSYPSDNSAFQQTSFSSSHGRSNSRQGMATFSSRAEQQALFKLPPTQANNNQKVVEWISRNEEIMQHSTLHGIPDSDKSSVRRSQKSASTSASPRVLRNKGHSKGISSESKRPSQDDKHSFKSKSTSSSSKQRSGFSRSAGDSSSAASAQTLTQRKGVRDPPQIKVAFFLLDEPIPYSTTVPGAEITLAKFKELITKKGTYRYFFKKATDDEFGREVPFVLEEICNDNAILPKWESKVVGHVKKVE